jgi:hypothetical protein
MTIHLQLGAIFKQFELGGWDWAHFLCLFKFFSDLTNFLKIHSLAVAQMKDCFVALFSMATLSRESNRVASFV